MPPSHGLNASCKTHLPNLLVFIIAHIITCSVLLAVFSFSLTYGSIHLPFFLHILNKHIPLQTSELSIHFELHSLQICLPSSLLLISIHFPPFLYLSLITILLALCTLHYSLCLYISSNHILFNLVLFTSYSFVNSKDTSTWFMRFLLINRASTRLMLCQQTSFSTS